MPTEKNISFHSHSSIETVKTQVNFGKTTTETPN